MSTPATLPANFFEKKTGQTGPPKTLPANFDFKKGVASEAPNPNDPARGAAQATGLSPDTRSSAGKIWDEVKRGLTSAQEGQGLKPQPTVTANAAQFAGMAGDTLARLGVGPEGAGAAGKAEGAVRGLFAPSKSVEMVPSGLLGPRGQELFKESIKYGPSAMDKALSNPVARKILEWVGHGVLGSVGATGAWQALKALGLTPGGRSQHR